MQRTNEYTGLLTGAWCWMLGHYPDAQAWLVYLSIVVALLNIWWLVRKILRAVRGAED